MAKHIKAIHLWKTASAKKLNPHAGREAITKGMAAQ
jgi:hypothetical protein